MEITPWTFEEADRYREMADQELRRLLAFKGYGLVPGIAKNLNVIFANNEVSVNVSQLEGVTLSGHLLQIAGDSVSLMPPRDKGRECYLVVHADGEIEQEVNHVFYHSPRYTYDFCSLGEIDENCLPFAKLINEGSSWKIQELYIPPCMALSSDPELINLVEEIRLSYKFIVQGMTQVVSSTEALLIRLLEADLNDCSKAETPFFFYKMIRRAAIAISSIKLPQKTLPKLPPSEPFNNNDILKTLAPFRVFFSQYASALSVEEKPVEKDENPVDYIVWDAEL